MKRTPFINRTMVSVSLALFFVSAAESRANEETIREFLRAYVDAFNRQELETVSSMWAETGTHIDRQTGERTEGREAIRADLEAVFQNPARTHLAGSADRIRFIRPDVVNIEGTTTTSVTDEDPEISQFTGILIKLGDNWQIGSIEEMPVAAGDALSDLDWVVGTWLDESGDGRIVSTFRWSEGGVFLIRTIAEESSDGISRQGTQIIGWDPRSAEIRSWTFNSDGSFGDGIWSKVGDDWMIKSSQTLSDGQAASATYVITPIDEDTLTMRLIGHEVEGQPVPASDPVTIVRLPESTTAAAGSETPQN